MAVTSFEMDERTLQTIDTLKGVFGVKTNAAVLRKALALALIASRNADEDHTVVLSGERNNRRETVTLVG